MMTILYVLDVKLIVGRREDVKIGEEKKRNEIAIHQNRCDRLLEEKKR